MQLFKHQQDLIKKNPDKFLLAWETGTGKTFGVLNLIKHKGIKSVVISCPKSLVQKWKEDVAAIGMDDCVFSFYSKEEFRKFYRVIPSSECVVMDEAHYFFGRSLIYKAMSSWIKKYKPKFVYALTATPYMSTPWNVYQAMLLLGKDDYGYVHFDATFFNRVRMGMRWIPVVKDFEEIRDELVYLIHQIGATVKLQDCVDMPDEIIQKEYFELTSAQTKAIKSIDEPLAIQRWQKVHQICGGTLKKIEGNEYLSCNKMQRLVETCRSNKKLVIVAAYTNEINMIETALVENFPDRHIYTFTGANSNNRISAAKEANKYDNSIVIVNAACSEGYELGTFELMVFYSQNFSLKDAEQMKGRIRRINSVHKCVYRYYIAEDSIDEDVYATFERKEQFQITLYANEH